MSNLKYVILLVFGLSLCVPQLLLLYLFVSYFCFYFAPVIGIGIAIYSVFKLMTLNCRKPS